MRNRLRGFLPHRHFGNRLKPSIYLNFSQVFQNFHMGSSILNLVRHILGPVLDFSKCLQTNQMCLLHDFLWIHANFFLIRTNVLGIRTNVLGIQTNIFCLHTNILGIQANVPEFQTNVPRFHANAYLIPANILGMRTNVPVIQTYKNPYIYYGMAFFPFSYLLYFLKTLSI